MCVLQLTIYVMVTFHMPVKSSVDLRPMYPKKKKKKKKTKPNIKK